MSEINLNVRHNSDVLSVPFTSTKDGLSAAIRHGGVNYFNKLVAPDAPNASKICLRHNNQTYALSLPQAAEIYVEPVVTTSTQIINHEKTVRGPYSWDNRPAGVTDDNLQWFWTEELADQEPGNIFLPDYFVIWFDQNNPQNNPRFIPFRVYGGATNDELAQGHGGYPYQPGDYFPTIYTFYRHDGTWEDIPNLPVISFSDDYSDENGDFYSKTGLDNYWSDGSAVVVIKWTAQKTTVNVAAMLNTSSDGDYYHNLWATSGGNYSPESYNEDGAAIMFLEVDEGYVIENISIAGQNGVALTQGTDYFLTDYTHNFSWYSADSSHITFTQDALVKAENKINLSYTFSQFID